MFPDILSHCEKYVYNPSNVPLSNGVRRMADLNQYTPKFDYIQCCHVLEHCTNPHEIISNIIKLSHNNSIFYIEVPNDTSVNSYKVRFFLEHPVINKMFSTITGLSENRYRIMHEHINFFTIDSMMILMKTHGLDIKHILTKNDAICCLAIRK